MTGLERSSLRRLLTAALSISVAACGRGKSDHPPAKPATARVDTAHPATAAASATDTTQTRGDTSEAGGEVALDSGATDSAASPVAGKWINDANVLSLFSLMNSRQIAAADIELSTWHTDSVRAFAAAMAREHAGLQHSADSVVDQIHIAPVAPALSAPIGAAMKSQIDSMAAHRGAALDRAFVAEQIASHQFMAAYIRQLAGVAEAPALQDLLSRAQARVSTQITRARALQKSLAIADSLAADSVAKREARRKRQAEP